MTSRVLIAEDSPTQAAALAAELEAAGFEVCTAAHGEQALDLLAVHPVDIVVSDVMMPVMGGYELCRKVKECHPELPVMLLTAMGDPMDVVHALTAGGDNFLRKPYESQDLIHRVRNMLYNRDLRAKGKAAIGLELYFLGQRFMINADRQQILDLLISTFEDLVGVNEQLRDREQELADANADIRARLGEIQLERNRSRAILDALPLGLVVVDHNGRVAQVNEQMATMLGLEARSLVGVSLSETVRLSDQNGVDIPPERWALTESITHGTTASMGTAFDMYVERPDGTRFPGVATAAPIHNDAGEVRGAVGMLADVALLSAHDPTTGLPGHGILVDRLRSAIHAAEGTDRSPALLVVTLDRFERIRNGLGVHGAERILSLVVDRAHGVLDSYDVVQRSVGASVANLGNGELAVVLPDTESAADAIVVAELLVDRVSGPAHLEGVDISVSVTVAVGMTDGLDDPAQLVPGVATAARQASTAGGARVATTTPELHTEVRSFLQREQELREAITSDQLVVHYQPQIDLSDGRAVAVEALVRWQHPEHGFLGAGDIIPVAVESGLIAPLSWHVLHRACEQAVVWCRDLPGGDRLRLSVNVAAEQLAEADIAEHVGRILADTGLDPRALILEVTEGSVMEEAAVAGERLEAIKALGVQIAIDDFGTGYSSLLQLRTLPVDILKVDRTFVSAMVNDPADAAIVAGTIQLGRALGLEMVAEGVETPDDVSALSDLGCDIGQGYHWAKPMGAAELAEWWSAREHSDQPV